MKITDVKSIEYDVYYKGYLSKVSNDLGLIDGFEKGKNDVYQFFSGIPEDKWDYRYGQDKWRIKELFQHIIDTERIFMHRCFHIARRDITPLPEFNENDYIVPSRAHEKSVEALLEEYKAVRQNFIILLKSLSYEDLAFIGNCSGHKLSARAAAFIILGHEIHHVEVVKVLYLNGC